MKPLELSYYIINNYTNKSSDGMTPLKLQKLLYYIYVWGVVTNNKILKCKFYKWEKGPVNPDVYQYFKQNGVKPDDSKGFIKNSVNKDFIDFVLLNYVSFNAITLSAMTHKDSPWQETFKNDPISDESILSFYSKLNFAKNFPIYEDKPFYPVETDLHYAFTLDLPQEIEKKTLYFNSFQEYLCLKEQSQKEFQTEFNAWLNKLN